MILTRFAVLALLFALLVPTVHAACELNVRFTEPATLVWDPVAGIRTYQVQESFDNYQTSRNYFVTASTFKINHRASASTKIAYIVTALLDTKVASVGASLDGCSEQITVTIDGDQEFRRMTRKAILPIVGSGPGAFGGRFKTTLKLTSNGPDERGRLVFHPAGAIASTNDPSIVYGFDGGLGQTIVFDDVVAQMGGSGVGSLDIVPDTNASSSVPTIEARLFNDTPNGTFGTSVQAYYPFDYLQPPTLTFIVPDTRFRVNLGVRTLEPAIAKVLIFGVNGRVRNFVDVSFPAGYTALGTFDSITGEFLAVGERVQIFFEGAAIPFYTVTENRTNDPEVFVARPEQSTNVGSYVE